MRRAPWFARRLRDGGQGESGSAAAEFALVIPLFVLMTIGIYNLSFMMYAASTLHYSVERTARCYAINNTLCSDVQVYGASQYKGPKITPTYTVAPATSTNCGYRVTGTGSFAFQTGLVKLTVPLSASACFPAMTAVI